MFAMKISVEVHVPPLAEGVQGKYLVMGEDDVLWTDSLEDALAFIRSEVNKLEGESD